MSQLATVVADQVDETALIEASGRRFVLAGQFAHAMCRASVLPEHLRTRRIDGKLVPLEQDEIEANCVMIANQALRWGVDPFAILPSTYVIGGKLGFDGKLIAAIVNQRGRLKGRLSRSYSGSGDNLTVTVSGTLQGEDEPRTVSVRLRDVRTSNEIWRKDPEQKLWYTDATRWARAHCPELRLGIIRVE